MATSHSFVTTKQVTTITSGKYYVIDGLNQKNGGTSGFFLYDNGTKVTSATSLPTDATVDNYLWKIEGNSTDGWTLQNKGTNNYMSLGSSNGSAISTSSTSQINSILFSGDYATVRNANGQAIDMGNAGTSPTTWSGTTTPDGSRRLIIQEVSFAEIEDDVCYTIDFVSNDGSTYYGLKSTVSADCYSTSTDGVSTLTAGTGNGDVYVAHSYTNQAGETRWIFVNNSDGSYLAYHGQAKTTFDVEKAVNEFEIQGLYKDMNTNVTTSDCAGKVCIINGLRYRNTGDGNNGCYILKTQNNALTYDNAAAPYYTANHTSALLFTSSATPKSDAATLAIAKFDAIQALLACEAATVHIPALFPAETVASTKTTIITAINAATTAAEVATALDTDTYWRIAEGRKFYAVPSTATSQYMNIGTSQITATATKLYAEAVMELEYAGSGKYYLKGTKSGYYAGNPVSGSANPGTVATSASATALYVGNYANTTDNVVYFARTTTGAYIEAIHYNDGYSAQGRVVAWSYNVPASQWNITAVSDDEYDALCNVCDVTYNVVLEANGTVKATATNTEVIGNALEVPSIAARDFCSYTFYSDAACTNAITTVPNEATTTVYVLASYTMPFTVSTNASKTWYYLRLNDGNDLAFPSYTGGEPNVTNPTTHTLSENANNWAFIGNPYDGITIINAAAGDGNVLGSASPEGDGNTGANTHATMGSGQTYETWYIKQSSNLTNGFYIENGQGYALNKRSTANLAYWTGGRDAGSTFRVDEASALETLVVNYATTYAVDDANLGKLAYPTAAGKTAFETALAAARSIAEVNAALATYKGTVVLPENGKYYVIKNVSNGKYIDVQSASAIYADATTPSTSSIVKAVVRNEKTYFATQEKEFGWCYYEGNPALLDAANGGKYAHFVCNTFGQLAFAHCLGNGEGNYATYLPGSYYKVKNDNQVAGGTSDNAAAQWIFEEVTEFSIPLNAVDGKSYATFCAPFDVTIGDGATAYTVALNADQTKAEYTVVTDNKVPAGAGVLIISDGAAASVVATINTGEAFSALTGNSLVGYYRQDEVTGENAKFTYDTSANSTWNLVLGVAEGSGIGFY